MTATALAVLGCTSDAGKSLLVTALARWLAREGVAVAPFKAQNMSNNARVVTGGEIGVAQWLQARAANVEPSVAMNPVLIKPEGDTRSQVVVAGRARPEITQLPWEERPPHLWAAMTDAYAQLAASHDVVLIEGAGSPAEINLVDLVNNRLVAHTDAAALLAVDIDRGGAFAHLVGTWSLVPDSTRTRLVGFVLNKFRGDPDLLAPAPDYIADQTGMHPVGVMPMLDHQLPDEEGGSIRAVGPADGTVVAIVRYPFSSNLDEWHLLPHAARVRWATAPADLVGADLIVLPGSKHVAADARWLAHRGLDRAVINAAATGTRVLGVCGGAMLLGRRIEDPNGVEGAADGLGLLGVTTHMDSEKLTRPATVTVPALPSPWSSLSGRQATGYEIRHGRIEPDPAAQTSSPLIWCSANVMATTVHGLFEHPEMVNGLCGIEPPPVLDQTFEILADAVERHLDVEFLKRLVGI